MRENSGYYLAKTFHVVPHKICIDKLLVYGLGGQTVLSILFTA